VVRKLFNGGSWLKMPFILSVWFDRALLRKVEGLTIDGTVKFPFVLSLSKGALRQAQDERRMTDRRLFLLHGFQGVGQSLYWSALLSGHEPLLEPVGQNCPDGA